MLTKNEKTIYYYIYFYQVIYSDRYIREVLRYIQPDLNKLNITHVMCVCLVLQQWHEQEMKGTFFIDSLKIKSEGEFIISSFGR